MRNIFRKQKVFFLLFLMYFLFRVPFLTTLPIFNDEAIYLDWGWREVHEPGFLFYSLYDAKQPLLMWIFGLSEKLFLDPLFAGRSVSVVTGFITLLGIYATGKRFISSQVAQFAALIYIVIPVFSFFDRQALMESAIVAVGVWILYYLLLFLHDQKLKYIIYVGVLLGICFFIKSTALIFFVTACILLIFVQKREKNATFIKPFVAMFLSFFLTDFLLFIQPKFWETFATTNRYSLSIPELIHLPIFIWAKNISGIGEILFFYITPLIMIASICGLILMWTGKNTVYKYIVVWNIINIFLLILLTKSMSLRYSVVFLVFLVIPAAAFMMSRIYSRKKHVWLSFIIVGVLVPILLSLYQLFSPVSYILSMSTVSQYSELGYVRGYTSGIGINNIVEYFLKKYPKENIFIGIAENSGNPESAVNVYFNKYPNIKVGYFESRYLGSLQDINCLSASTPFYYVSREDQLAGLQRYFTNLKFYKNPYSDYRIGVYILKKDCKGKTLSIEAVKS